MFSGIVEEYAEVVKVVRIRKICTLRLNVCLLMSLKLTRVFPLIEFVLP